MLAVLPLVTQLLSLGATLIPELVDDFNLAKDLLTSGKDPTPEQQAQIDAALDRANAALQEALTL